MTDTRVRHRAPLMSAGDPHEGLLTLSGAASSSMCSQPGLPQPGCGRCWLLADVPPALTGRTKWGPEKIHLGLQRCGGDGPLQGKSHPWVRPMEQNSTREKTAGAITPKPGSDLRHKGGWSRPSNQTKIQTSTKLSFLSGAFFLSFCFILILEEMLAWVLFPLLLGHGQAPCW